MSLLQRARRTQNPIDYSLLLEHISVWDAVTFNWRDDLCIVLSEAEVIFCPAAGTTPRSSPPNAATIVKYAKTDAGPKKWERRSLYSSDAPGVWVWGIGYGAKGSTTALIA